MVQRLETEIDGYEVHLELYEENREPRSDCWVGLNTGRRKFHWSASLAALEATGYLPCNHDCCGDHVVPERTIERIQAWATDNGY